MQRGPIYPWKVIRWIDSVYSGDQNAIKPTEKEVKNRF